MPNAPCPWVVDWRELRKIANDWYSSQLSVSVLGDTLITLLQTNSSGVPSDLSSCPFQTGLFILFPMLGMAPLAVSSANGSKSVRLRSRRQFAKGPSGEKADCTLYTYSARENGGGFHPMMLSRSIYFDPFTPNSRFPAFHNLI